MKLQLLLQILLVFLLSEGEANSCANTLRTTRETKPLYLLTLVPFPDTRDDTGWDGGLGTVPGARVAQHEINQNLHFFKAMEENPS